MKSIGRGEIHWVNLDPARGSEMAKRRPCVVLSVKEINDHRRTVVVLPLTTTDTPAVFPLLIATPSVGASSKVRIEHIRSIDKSRLSGYITDMGRDDLLEIERALCKVLALQPHQST
ncbi:MAG: type II toxin-antitoxin system PemK/MazF family toxin [Burkholderiales bacterium]|nr:type II toxin-antitoxin system PemK/MazF family toxin [Burkholderiales bacterium]